MEYFKDLLEFLTEEEFYYLMVNIANFRDKDYHINKMQSYTKPLDVISHSFPWNETLQGSDYWSDIYKRIDNNIKP